MKVNEIAQKVLERLGPNGENWTQGKLARDATGRQTEPTSQQSVCWCVAGAVVLVVDTRREECNFHDAFMKRIRRRKYNHNIAAFNDNHTFPAVKAVLEELAK